LFIPCSVPALSTHLSDFSGEFLQYEIHCLGLKAGEASITIQNTLFENKPAIQISAFVHSADWYSSIYYVEDSITSILDPQTMLPLKISVDYREGKKYERKTNYIFDYKNHKVISTRDGGQTKTLDLPPHGIDLFGVFFLLRMNDFSKNKNLIRQVVDGRRTYQVEAQLNSIVDLSTIFGSKECLEIQPHRIPLEMQGKRQKDSEILLFLTNDSKRIPVLFKLKIKFGTFDVKLVNYQKKKN
jgi:hypothetical protein